jgi:predicted ABC-type ATPase
MATPPQAVIIAGPNGSGKSTAATKLLPPEMTFVNADVIAQELTGKPGTAADINAGRILLDRVEALEARQMDFAFETTLATKMLANRVREWRRAGYQVHLVFMYLPSADLSVERVEQRVNAGGHHVPEATIRRRFAAGLRHFFHLYRPLVHTWRIYDNSTIHPRLIARGTDAGVQRVDLPEVWSNLVEEMTAGRETK